MGVDWSEGRNGCVEIGTTCLKNAENSGLFMKRDYHKRPGYCNKIGGGKISRLLLCPEKQTRGIAHNDTFPVSWTTGGM